MKISFLVWSLVNKMTTKQTLCVVFHDKVCKKNMLLYHGGNIFGRSEDDLSVLTKTTLGILIYCLDGGSKIFARNDSRVQTTIQVSSKNNHGNSEHKYCRCCSQNYHM